jgi:hypothetical protein
MFQQIYYGVWAKAMFNVHWLVKIAFSRLHIPSSWDQPPHHIITIEDGPMREFTARCKKREFGVIINTPKEYKL